MRSRSVRNLTLAGMFLAIGLVLPFVTGQIPEIGRYLLPMHLPVMLCGLICGWRWGAGVGFVCPLLRSALFHTPAVPECVGMAFELCAYGLIIGVVYSLFRRKNVGAVYVSLVAAMLGGRVVWGIARAIMVGAAHLEFSWGMFVTVGFVKAIPGLVLQLVLIPVILAFCKNPDFSMQK